MTREQLLEEVKKVQAELTTEREERNYFQLERARFVASTWDKIMSLWEITKHELGENKAMLLNKDRELEEQEEKHQVEIKVYKQKVKHLLYEYQNNVAHLQTSHTKSLTQTGTEHDEQQSVLRKDKRALKLELKELELSHEDVVRNLKSKHDAEINALRVDFERRAKELQTKYDKKMKSIRDDLELRRKNEIHEIEERKNGQINALMKNHEKAFSEIKNYYNDITLNNLALINSLKEQVEEMKKKEERNEKLMADIVAENKRLSEPLQQALADGESLRKQLGNYQKDKMSLQNSKARLKVLEESHKSLQWEHEVLQQRFAQVQKERDDLYNQFLSRVVEVQQKTGFKNLMLEKKLEALRTSLEKKDIQLHELLAQSHVDPATAASISKKLDEIIDAKNLQIRELQLDLARVTKAHNDLIRTFQAKMVENGIPIDDLTLKPLVTNATILPVVSLK
ncbi:growth-arrest-specific micro-tubule binding-domain-containing protein [Catenaria anguillulae PL171]|uniref:Growth-arrest-specific micro-tubule binding-domain-containing protein n=1 Tax=Catenaria anguillulae PL171 TaxID=765915 RepID=A0A1Y2HZ46_9FUNG|nr:growth-arrest-specific micro-tubule binding-domain-containing protein [Catenaria anguillulae PL171]